MAVRTARHRRARGVPRRPWVAALLNLTGLGAGYPYLHRWIRWPGYLTGLGAIGYLAYTNDAAGNPAMWLGIAGGWVLLSVIDAGLIAWRTVRVTRDTGRSLGRPILAVAVAIVLIAGVAGAALAYQQAGREAFEDGLAARKAADCDAAVDRFTTVTTTYELTLDDMVARADAAIVDCRAFQAADQERTDGRYEPAVTAFDAYLVDHPDSPLLPTARDRLAQTYSAWAGDLAADGDFEGAVELYEAIATDLAETPTATQARSDEAGVHLAWATTFIDRKDYVEGLERLNMVRGTFQATDAAAEAQAAIDDLFQVALDDVNPDTGCEARQLLDSFLEAGILTVKARNNLPSALFNCGRSRFDAGIFESALVEYRRLLDDFPNNKLAADTRKAVIVTRIADAKVTADDFGEPFRFGIAAAGTVVLKLQNDSPVRQEFLFSGPEVRSVIIDPCETCVRYAEGEEPNFCPAKGPVVEVTLEPGTYEMAVLALGDELIRAAYSEWTLASGSTYANCVILFER